jgi:carbon monoxide dehydrogenase subunit G
MISCSSTYTIAAPSEQVFEMFSDFEAMPGRIKGIKRIEVVTPGPLRVGTQFRETRQMHGHDATELMEITVFHRPRRYAVSCRSCGSLITTTFRFDKVPEGTRLNVEIQAEAQSWFVKLLSPLAKILLGMIQKCVTQDVLDLKQVLESAAPAVV